MTELDQNAGDHRDMKKVQMAYLEGKPIQRKSRFHWAGRHWVDDLKPEWHPSLLYRIKPP